jgi:hypothetical protein
MEAVGMAALKVNLFDSAFSHVPYSVPGRTSKHIQWVRGPREKADPDLVTVITDEYLMYVGAWPKRSRLMVGWLLEGRAYGAKHYNAVPYFIDRLDLLLTHDDLLLRRYPEKARFVPFGGCWIPDEKWGMHPKTKLVSMIYSGKNFMEGHKLRHQVAAMNLGIDLYGHGCGRPIACKSEGLADYMFSVVIENDRAENYFTEKILDCFALGTIPIYWGAPNIGRFFEPHGILSFETISQLGMLLSVISEQRLTPMMRIEEAAERNLVTARKYVLPEDYMYEHHLKAFDA